MALSYVHCCHPLAMEAQGGGTSHSAQAKIWKFIYGFADSFVLRCAVELGIADIIHKAGRPITLSELAAQLPLGSVNKDNLYRVLRYLVHMKLFFTEQTTAHELVYGLGPSGKYLVSGWDQSMAAMILTGTDMFITAPWYHLQGALAAGGATAFEAAHGMNIWEYMVEHPDKNKMFNEAMACDSQLSSSALVQECGDMFQAIGSIIDVGGGTGTALRAIAKAFPDIKCTVLDLPHVISDSPDYPEVARVAGDMFKSIPTADAILMKGVLHDWGDEDCVKILKKCKEAVVKEGGKVIIVESVLDAESSHPLAHMRMCMDLDMLLTSGGKERTEAEWKKLIQSAGYRDYKIRHISAVQSVIEAYPH